MISTDGGKNFVPSNNGFSGRFVNAILPDRENMNRVYATTINTATGGGFFFVSSDGGSSWQPSMRNMPPRLIGYSIFQDERDSNVLYLGTNLGVYSSADRGGSWAPVTGRKPAAPAKTKKKQAVKRTVAQSPASRGASAPQTSQQTSTSAKLSETTIRQAQEALEKAGYEIGTPDGQLGPRTIAVVKRFQTDHFLPVTGQLDQTTLETLGLSSASSALTASHLQSLTEPVNALASFSGPQGPEILAATNAGLFRTSDPMLGWDRISYGQNVDARTTCISTSQKAILVGTSTSGVLMSRDAGQTWQQVSGIPNTFPVNVIVQDPQRPSFIYVGTKQAFFMSQDGGESWSRRGGNLPFGDFTSILINPRNTNELFVGNAFQNGEFGGGVYRSNDSGTTWVRIDAREHRLPSFRIWALALDPRDQNTLFVGSHSAGVYVVPRGVEGTMSERR
jgi:peptidoglycan hydrolase-like protein with peptidoglycan-binding domain